MKDKRVLSGWLLDLYTDPRDGVVLWLLAEAKDEDNIIEGRLRLTQTFPITIYVAGPNERLRALWQYLASRDNSLKLARTERTDLFQSNPITVLAIQVQNPDRQSNLFFRIAATFPDLTYYDADLAITLRHAAVHHTFPLAKMSVSIDQNNCIQDLEVTDSPWDTDPIRPQLRVMQIAPDCDPRSQSPQWVEVCIAHRSYRFSMQPIRPLLIGLGAIIRRYDPDLLLTQWGDTWLLPYLLEQSEKMDIPLPLNRDERQAATHRPERSYQAYGQVIYRGRQVQLFGRWHIDIFNAVMFHDYGIEGVLESARVTALSAQQAARLSPGTGISAMQIVTALQRGVLVPWHKQQAETPKSALDLMHVDQGGLVYQPIPGLHREVAEIDFVSMYPSIMAHFNISPETVGSEDTGFKQVPELNLWIDPDTPGLVPQTLRPLLKKRIALKSLLSTLPRWDPRKEIYKSRVAAHKWLLVTCFGYLGYKNARFGRIEAHQSVTAYSRECLLRAKEAAEDAGYTVLHLYVDGLWVQKPNCNTTQDIQPLLDEIVRRTHLPIALDGIYRWVVFSTSRSNESLSVANRYFGVFQDGSLKVRGIEARRKDTPPFIADTQMAILEQLAQATAADQLPDLLPTTFKYLRCQIKALRERLIPLKHLIVTQKLSRELALYRSPSPAAQAAAQLVLHGKTVRPGQSIRFLYVLGEPCVHAWDCLPLPNHDRLDTSRYIELLLRAAETVLTPIGVNKNDLRNRLLSHAWYDPTVYTQPIYSQSASSKQAFV